MTRPRPGRRGPGTPGAAAQRIDVERVERVAQLDRQLGQRHDGPGHGAPGRPGDAPRTPSSTGAIRRRGQGGQCPLLVQGRQAHHPVGQQLDQDPAGPHHHQRAQVGVADQAQGQLHTRRGPCPATTHPWAETAGQVRVGGSRRLAAPVTPSTTPPTSDLWAIDGSSVFITTG